MKVNTKVTFVWDEAKEEYVEESAEFYTWDGAVVEAKGGGEQQTTTTEPWAEQQPYLTDLFGKAQEFQQAAPVDTSASQTATQQAIAGYGEAATGATSFLDPIRATTQQYAAGALLDPSTNPAFQDYLNLSNQAILQQYTEGVLPALTGGAAAAGNIGSSRQGVAEALSAGKTMESIARSSAGLTSAAYGQGLQATMQAQALAPGYAETYGLAPQFQTQAASLQYGLDTQAEEASRQRLMDYQRLVGGQYGGTTTGAVPTGQTGGLSGALGGAATGAALMTAVGSTNPWIAGAGAVAGYFS